MVRNIISISGEHVYVESGVPVVISGQPVSISGALIASGIYIASGIHVVADIAESGMGVNIQSGAHVLISGQHVFVESGVHVVADIEVDVSSGQHVVISGQPMTISGDHVFIESGVYLASGIYVVADIAESGMGVNIQSGAHVWVSGQHLYQESGAFITAEIIGGGTRMEIDTTAEAGVIIQTPHHMIHEGNMFHGVCQISGLADAGINDLLIVPGSGLEIHAVFEGACGGDGWFELYEDTRVSDNGTAIPAVCMNRYTSGIPKTLLYCSPTITSAHTKLTVDQIPGGQKKEAIGGTMRNTEWILSNVSGLDLNYLARIINAAGAAKDTMVGIEFYEEPPGY